jgi:predicted transposase YbfD/YdcC
MYFAKHFSRRKVQMNTNTKPENKIRSIASVFSEMLDQRKPKGIRYQFQSMLILLSLSKLCHQDTPSEIYDWVKNRSAWLNEKLDLDWKRMPSLTTWQRLIAQNIDASEFDEKVGQYFRQLSSNEREEVNLDGKVVCGTIAKETDKQLHLLALQTSKTNSTLEQTALLEGENEISGAKRLLAKADLENKIVSGDAIFAQKELSKTVVEKGGEYLWKLRANQGKIYKTAKEYFEKTTDKYLGKASSLDKGHGRIDERKITTSFRIAGETEFPYVAQVFRIERKSEEVKTGKVSIQTIYGITSLPVEEYGAKELLKLTRNHWQIENGLHYRRDVTFKEDSVKQTSKNGGRVLAALNNLTIGVLRNSGWENIAEARRFYNAFITEALNLIMLPLKRLL